MKRKHLQSIVFFLLAWLCGIGNIQAQEPYAVLSDNNTVLTFYYDNQKETRSGMSVGPFDSSSTTSWYDQRGSITTVVFDASFAECTTLSSTAYWFSGFSNLTTITGIRNLYTDNVTNMGLMFSGCSKLTSIDVSGFKTDNVTDMSFMFSSCKALTSLNVSGFKTDNVTNMGYMFYSCYDLTDLDLSGFKTVNVTNMESMFESCSKLTSLDVSSFKTDKVTDMFAMFSGCSKLTSIDLRGFKTDNVTNMRRMFEWCSSLTSLDVSGFKTDNVTNMRGMFYKCESLTSLDVSGFKTDNVTNMRNMFYLCESLTSLDVSGFKTDKVTDMESMFEWCSKLTSLDVSGFKTDNVTNMCAMFHKCESLTSLDVSGFRTDNVTNMQSMFHGCSSLTTIYADPENWRTANVTNSYDMFSDCTNLVGGNGTAYDSSHRDKKYARIDKPGQPGYFTDINDRKPELAVGDLFTEQTIEGVTMTFMVTSLDPMECQVGDGTQACIDKATTGDVTVPAMPRGFVTRRLGDHGFAGCSKVEHFWMNDSIWYIGAHAFDGCLTARSVDLPRYVREVAHNFVDHEMEIHVPATASQSVIESVSQACESTGSTVSISKPKAEQEEAALERVFIWRQVRGIDEHAFGNMPSVKEMVVDAENPYFDSRGDCHAIIRTEDNTLLFGCQNTFIPETVTAIAAYAFEGHNKLKGITIPAAVKIIGEAAFTGCDKMTLVKSLITTPTAIADNTFDAAVYAAATLIVPYGTKARYASTDGWRNFVNIEEMEVTELAQGGGTSYDGTGGVDETTPLDGNVIGNVYYNIGSENGGFNANEGCIVVTKPTADEELEGLDGDDIFGEALKNQFTGIIFKVPAGKGSVKVTAETTGSMVLKVKIGNAAPMEMELEGKLKASFPYDVAVPSYVYIYAGQAAAAVKAQYGGAIGDAAGELKIYGIELSSGEDGIEVMDDGHRTMDDAVIYNLSGQRLSKPQRGVNIINGKKIVVK